MQTVFFLSDKVNKGDLQCEVTFGRGQDYSTRADLKCGSGKLAKLGFHLLKQVLGANSGFYYCDGSYHD